MTHSTPPIDFSALLEMLGGKREIVVGLLGTFLDELAADIEASRQAVDAQDTERLRQIAHRIKGTSANLHAMVLSSAARELESACTEADFSLVSLKHNMMCAQSQQLSEAIRGWRE